MLATGLAALSFHNPRAEREFELEEEFELTGAAAQSAFLQTQSRGADPPGMDCICESMKCNCLKPCACGEPTFNLETFSIEIDGGCYCNKLECDCQKRCSCYPPPDTLPPPPPFPPPSPPPRPPPSPPPPFPPPPAYDPCGCAGDYAGLSSGWIPLPRPYGDFVKDEQDEEETGVGRGLGAYERRRAGVYVASSEHRRRRRRVGSSAFTDDKSDIPFPVPDAMPWARPKGGAYLPGLGDGPHANGNIARQPAVLLKPPKEPMQLMKPKVRSGCKDHIHDGIIYCYILEPDECTRPDITASIQFPGSGPCTAKSWAEQAKCGQRGPGPAFWLPCNEYTGMPIPYVGAPPPPQPPHPSPPPPSPPPPSPPKKEAEAAAQASSAAVTAVK